MNQLSIYCAILFSLIFFSCGNDEPFDDTDTRLNQAIAVASDYVGKSHYILPYSDDFRRIPQDPQNLLSTAKVTLGKNLFHETAFALDAKSESSMQTFSCASCHHAGAGFQAGIAQGIADGGIGFGMNGESRKMHLEFSPDSIDVQPLRSPSAMNLAYQTNVLWNGQFGATNLNVGTESNWQKNDALRTNNLGYEGLETQAIAGLTVHRFKFNKELVTQYGYKEMWDAAFKNVDESVRYDKERAGQAIAAYERTLLSNNAPFQQWLRGDYSAMTATQKEGAILFFGKGQCANCHNGPSLAKMEFHCIGLENFDGSEVFHFNMTDPATMGRAQFTGREADMNTFKTPQLYNLKDSPFYGHGSSFESIREIIEYKNEAIPENQDVNPTQLSEFFVPLNLTDEEINHLTDFIENGLYDPNLDRYLPTSLPSGFCFPNNDPESRVDLGCQ